MYYNSNKNNYYNAYKEELQELKDYNQQEKTQKIIKLIVISLTAILIVFTAIYLYKYFNPNINNSTQFVQTNYKDITKKISKEEQYITIEKRSFEHTAKKDIIKKPTKISLEEQLITVEKTKFENKSLKETNHYNKIILTSTQEKNNSIQNSDLYELTNNINSILNNSTKLDTSNYSSEITKEVKFRTNAMRVIIVRRGDTLSKLAKKAYGNYEDYTKIFAANPEIIQNPNQIFIGQRLRIPS